MAQTEVPVPLWPQGAPGALGKEPKDIPTLTPYLAPAEKASGAAVVICPGGGYGALASHEGHDYALFLNQQGVHAFVLKYRLGTAGYRHPAMLQDVQRALRLVRARAGEGGGDKGRGGVMGSSAGGHLAATVLTHFDRGVAGAADVVERESCRPDLGILCYPVISMGPLTHEGSRFFLLGPNPDPELVKLLSNELQVTAETPPCFVWHTADDAVVKVENALEFAGALSRHKVPYALHIYPHGPHGLGLGDKPPFAQPHPWAQELVRWLKGLKFIKA
ncbi:MAG: alpha/beta hydrolase [Verrucomicrobiae bacterium]|nr:alpha/beta hydrolase [Verrucomicrobiae bacterium]